MIVIATDGLNIRQNADVNSNKIGSFAKWSVIEVTNITNNYYKLANQDGYISVNYTLQFLPVDRYATDVLNIRSLPNVTSAKLGQTTLNQKVEVDSSFSTNGYVPISNPQKGYVLGAWLNDTPSSGATNPEPPKTTPKYPYLYGLHIETTGLVDPLRSQIIEMCKRLYNAGRGLSCVVVLDDVALANELVKYVRYVIFRSYPASENFRIDACNSVESARNHADYIWNKHLPFIVNLDKRCFIQTRNEKGITPFDYAYEIRMMELAESVGRLIGMFGDSVGTPNSDQWKWRIPALIRAGGIHAAILHEYGAFVNGKVSSTPMSDPATRAWYALRHEMLYNSVPANAKPLLLIGECGTSDGYVHGQDTITDLYQYNSLLLNDPYVGGFALWGMGRSYYNNNWLLPAIEKMIMSS